MTVPEAFDRDDFTVVNHVAFQGKNGYRAEHKTAVNVVTGKKKYALYVEGDAYEMGYLTALLAPDSVEVMATKFLVNIAPAYFGADQIRCPVTRFFVRLFSRVLVGIVKRYADVLYQDVPADLKLEMHGLADGLRSARPRTRAGFLDIWTLNAGVDIMLSVVYNPASFLRGLGSLLRGWLRIPLFCNGFSVFNNALAPGERGRAHYFGRDFMFPTADIFQDEACLIVYHPNDGRLPLVSGTAPGFVASTTSLNRQGVALGVHMVAGGNCNAARPGYNSILLVRGAGHHAASAQAALDYITAARRGVTWLYLIGDGAHDRALVAEAGMSAADLDPVRYPPERLYRDALLPGAMELFEHDPTPMKDGVAARWNDYRYPERFLGYNPELFGFFNCRYDAAMMGPQGYISRWVGDAIDPNCPDTYYFPPQREDKDDVLVATNHFIAPALRLCAMADVVSLLTQAQVPDFQWRYDKLNDLILGAYGAIDEARAWQLINFIAAEPTSACPGYYAGAKDYEYDDGGVTRTTKSIPGMTCLCELKGQTMRARYGYYADRDVVITLPHYVP